MLFEIIFIITAAAAGLIAVDGMRVREIAVQASRKHCADLSLQFLDQSVSHSKTRPIRNNHGKLVVLRRYRFEFTSTGDERYKGYIEMHGQRLASIDLDAHRLPSSESI